MASNQVLIKADLEAAKDLLPYVEKLSTKDYEHFRHIEKQVNEIRWGGNAHSLTLLKCEILAYDGSRNFILALGKTPDGKLCYLWIMHGWYTGNYCETINKYRHITAVVGLNKDNLRFGDIPEYFAV